MDVGVWTSIPTYEQIHVRPFRYRHRHFQVLEGPKIASMVLLGDLNRPLSGCLNNARVHIGIKFLS